MNRWFRIWASEHLRNSWTVGRKFSNLCPIHKLRSLNSEVCLDPPCSYLLVSSTLIYFLIRKPKRKYSSQDEIVFCKQKQILTLFTAVCTRGDQFRHFFLQSEIYPSMSIVNIINWLVAKFYFLRVSKKV